MVHWSLPHLDCDAVGFDPRWKVLRDWDRPGGGDRLGWVAGLWVGATVGVGWGWVGLQLRLQFMQALLRPALGE